MKIRIIKHQSTSFLSENVSDKLRIQLYKINRNNTEISASNLVGKKDVFLYSIVSRETYANLLINNDVNDLEPINSNYSSFSHGNNLNAMMGLNNNNTTMTKSRHMEKTISRYKFII
jgi:hypothetical protein